MSEKDNISKFLVNNEKFELLVSNLKKFNPFKILKIEDYEIRHSNVLAWLFNPSENHNLDDKILRKFLLGTASKSDNEDILTDDIHLLDLQQANLNDVKVLREEKNIDILIISKTMKLVVLIENKIYANEGHNQLNSYLKKINNSYVDYKVFPIYLTLLGDKPSSLKYCTASYQDILNSVEFTLSLNKDRITSSVLDFINFYLNILKEKVIVDDKLKELCKSIYSENQEAIDLIYSVGNEIDISKSIIEFKKTYYKIDIVSQTNKNFWFLIPAFKTAKRMNTNWANGYPVSYWFEYYYGKLKIVLEIGPFDDGSQRTDFMNYLSNLGIQFQKRAMEPGRKYTRIFTATHNIEDWSNHQEIIDAMQELFAKKKLRNIESILIKGINEFQW